MRRLTILNAFVLPPVAAAMLALSGCADGEKKGDSSTPPPSSTAQAQQKPQPRPTEAKPVDSKPADAPGDEPIVIKGSSKHKDSSGSSTESPASKQARIDELKAKAKASEGKDNGEPVTADPREVAAVDKKEKTRQEIQECDNHVAKLQDEKAAMGHKGSQKQGRRYHETTTYDDPKRAEAIDKEIADTYKKKEGLQKKLAAMEAGTYEEPKGPAPR